MQLSVEALTNDKNLQSVPSGQYHQITDCTKMRGKMKITTGNKTDESKGKLQKSDGSGLQWPS
jgi:hypothetical protein